MIISQLLELSKQNQLNEGRVFRNTRHMVHSLLNELRQISSSLENDEDKKAIDDLIQEYMDARIGVGQ